VLDVRVQFLVLSPEWLCRTHLHLAFPISTTF
jgi:hypothetical protein